MPINETLSWNDVGAISTGGSNYVRDAFKGMHAEKVLLLPGTKLYKFNEYNSLAPPNAPFISPWWTSYDAYRHDPGWIQKKKLAAQFHVSIRELGRVTSAVKENWNSLSYLLVIVTKNLPGGGTQFYIPNLAPSDVSSWHADPLV